MLSIILSGLQHAKSTLSYQTVLDVLSLALALSEIQTIIDTDWVGHIVPLVATLLDDNGDYNIIYHMLSFSYPHYRDYIL